MPPRKNPGKPKKHKPHTMDKMTQSLMIFTNHKRLRFRYFSFSSMDSAILHTVWKGQEP